MTINLIVCICSDPESVIKFYIFSPDYKMKLFIERGRKVLSGNFQNDLTELVIMLSFRIRNNLENT